MDLCDNYIGKGGKKEKLSEHKKKDILKNVVTEQFAKSAFRTLAIAVVEISFREYESLKKDNNNFAKEDDREILESGLSLIGIYALMDPLRDEIVESVQRCHNAGINVRMVTGDNLDTAKAIAI